jgi:LAO/AO transport system kinase
MTFLMQKGLHWVSDQLLRGDRAVLAQAITLVESSRIDHQDFAQELLLKILPHSGNSVRVGISGVPGVGKSTFIDSFGIQLLKSGKKVAVLAVDPTSSRTGGSILGDKTRMERLSLEENAFIRPSPTGGNLGGVARKTRESMFLCEAAGFDVVLVETVGVGQSEHAVAQMVDFFVLLMLARAGDELQGIKRGILEVCDLIAVNKSDSEEKSQIQRTLLDCKNALHIVRNTEDSGPVPVVPCSGLTGDGLDIIWRHTMEHVSAPQIDLSARRAQQMQSWFWDLVEQGLLFALRSDARVAELSDKMNTALARKETTPLVAARRVIDLFLSDSKLLL